MRGYSAAVNRQQGVITLEATAESTPVAIPGILLKSVLGSGANGIAFLGEDGLGRAVTVKVWPLRLMPARTLERVQEQAIAEAKKIAGLKHDSIGIVYQVSRLENGWPFTVSEYMPGVPLAEARNELDFGHRRIIVMSVLSALKFAEQRGVLHGDLHDRNIVYDPEWWRGPDHGSGSTPIVRLIDFGTSAFAGKERSGERHARMLRDLVFGLWPELLMWLRPLTSLDQRVGFDMLPALQSGVNFVLLFDRLENPRPEIAIRGVTTAPLGPPDPAIVGTQLVDLVDCFDLNFALSRLVEIFSMQDIQQCQKLMLSRLLSYPEADERFESPYKVSRALDQQLRLHGQHLDKRWFGPAI